MIQPSLLGYDIGVGIFIFLIVIDSTVSVIYKKRRMDWIFAVASWVTLIFFLLEIFGVFVWI